MARRSPSASFQEAPFQEANLSGFSNLAIRDLGLRIEGTALEPVIAEFREELLAVGLVKVQPRFYLSTEWGVPFDTVAVAIPFYLARPDLTALHVERTGFTEGVGRSDLLRYLRHEMGHVVNYAYKLYDEEDWVECFGAITQPYVEEYRPQAFSRRYVHHLPGWYAQKHPDEDWAETFAVWMTPGSTWPAEYAEWPEALAKLRYCARTMQALADREPLVTLVADTDLDEDVGDIAYTLDQYYSGLDGLRDEFPPGLDGALRSIFEDLGRPDAASAEAERRPAAELIRRLERDLPTCIFRWTGHFPERTRALLEHLAERAEVLQQVYPEDRETPAILALTTMATTLAAGYVHRGSYLP